MYFAVVHLNLCLEHVLVNVLVFQDFLLQLNFVVSTMLLMYFLQGLQWSCLPFGNGVHKMLLLFELVGGCLLHCMLNPSIKVVCQVYWSTVFFKSSFLQSFGATIKSVLKLCFCVIHQHGPSIWEYFTFSWQTQWLR